MPETTFGTILVPDEALELSRAMLDAGGWRTVAFSQAGHGFDMVHNGNAGFVDFASAPLPVVDAAAILFTEPTAAQAEALAEAFGRPIERRLIAAPPTPADRAWLNDLAVARFGDMLEELTQGQAENAILRAEIDELRTKFALLETYLHRHDVPPLRKIWHAPFREKACLDTSVPFVAALPCSPWGLTRLQLWIVSAPGDSDACLEVQLKAADSREIVADWSISPAQTDHRSGWLSFDLETSLCFYGRPLELAISGAGWRLGASAPWLVPDGSRDGARTFAGPAVRVYATLPGIRGPHGLPLPTDDRRRCWLLGEELAKARALAVPPDLSFPPVIFNANGLVVHPVADMMMVAIINDGCPPQARLARLAIRHDHMEGDPFLVTLAPATRSDEIPDAEPDGHAPRVAEAGVESGIGPVPSGTWVRLDAGARACITFVLEPSSRHRMLQIATRPAEMQRVDLAWATVSSVEFVLVDG